MNMKVKNDKRPSQQSRKKHIELHTEWEQLQEWRDLLDKSIIVKNSMILKNTVQYLS